MAHAYGIAEAKAKAKFSILIEQAERGEAVAITRHGKTLARRLLREYGAATLVTFDVTLAKAAALFGYRPSCRHEAPAAQRGHRLAPRHAGNHPGEKLSSMTKFSLA